MAQALLDLLLPPRCLACKQPAWTDPRILLCSACAAQARPKPRCGRCARTVGLFLRGPGCPLCTGPRAVSDALARTGAPSGRAAIAGVVAACDYEGAPRDLVRALKFARRIGAARPLADWLAQAVHDAQVPGELVVPVPLSRRRRLVRGFNQTALIARRLARALDRTYAPRALVRTRHGPPQARTAHSQRAAAIRGAFRGRPRHLRGCTVLLVDDVLTTGSTVRAAAKALRQAGAASVHVAVVCRAGRG